MSNRFAIVLAFCAGMIGGTVTRYFAPAPVYAQTSALPQEIRAQRFVVVDEHGVAQGVFGLESNGSPWSRRPILRGGSTTPNFNLGPALPFTAFLIRGSRPCCQSNGERHRVAIAARAKNR